MLAAAAGSVHTCKEHTEYHTSGVSSPSPQAPAVFMLQQPDAHRSLHAAQASPTIPPQTPQTQGGLELNQLYNFPMSNYKSTFLTKEFAVR